MNPRYCVQQNPPGPLFQRGDERDPLTPPYKGGWGGFQKHLFESVPPRRGGDSSESNLSVCHKSATLSGQRERRGRTALVLYARFWKRGPGAGDFVTGEAWAIPFEREPYTTTPRPVPANSFYGGRSDAHT